VLGETAREIGILLIVFVPLDAAFAPAPMSLAALMRTVVAALGLIIGGIIMESRESRMTHEAAWDVILAAGAFLLLCGAVINLLRGRGILK